MSLRHHILSAISAIVLAVAGTVGGFTLLSTPSASAGACGWEWVYPTYYVAGHYEWQHTSWGGLNRVWIPGHYIGEWQIVC